jgi:hypothetical protein
VSARAALVLVLALALVACRREAAVEPVAPPRASAPSVPAPAPPAAATVAPPDDELVEEPPESNPTSETVTIKLVADPQRKARVTWGRKDLGFAPLELQRPRGSGPLDLVVVAPGALPLHTRVYTDRDDKLALRLYAESEAPSMLGYHAPVENPTKTSSPSDAPKRKRKP